MGDVLIHRLFGRYRVIEIRRPWFQLDETVILEAIDSGRTLERRREVSLYDGRLHSSWRLVKPKPTRQPPDRVRDGDYTLVEDQEAGPRSLAVRPVSEAERRMVWRYGGFLFATAEDAELFAKGELMFRDGPQVARQAFSHKRVDGRRIYVHLRAPKRDAQTAAP